MADTCTYKEYMGYLHALAQHQPLDQLAQGILDAYYENNRLREALEKIKGFEEDVFDCASCLAAEIAKQTLKGVK